MYLHKVPSRAAARQTANPLRPGIHQFIAISVFAILINVLFQFLLSLLPLVQPLGKGLIETMAVAICILPFGYFYYLRPLSASILNRQNAERTLLRSETHYKIVSDLTTTFVFDLSISLDRTVSLDFLSDNFYSFAGRTEEPRTFESLFSHIHADDSAKLKEKLGKLILSSQSTEIECRAYVNNPQEYRWFVVYGKSEWDDDQRRVTTIYGAVTDITERKIAEEALRKSDARHESMLANISDVIGIIGTDGIVKYISPNCEKVFGWKKEDRMGKDGWTPVHPYDLERMQKEFYELLEKDRSVMSAEYKYKCKDGSYKPVHVTGVNLVNDPSINGVLVNYLDITDRKRAEDTKHEMETILSTGVDTARKLTLSPPGN